MMSDKNLKVTEVYAVEGREFDKIDALIKDIFDLCGICFP